MPRATGAAARAAAGGPGPRAGTRAGRPWQGAEPQPPQTLEEVAPAQASADFEAGNLADMRASELQAKQVPRALEPGRLRGLREERTYLDYAPDPEAKVQTGPGRPDEAT